MEDDEFTLDSGTRRIVVELERAGDPGLSTLSVGDRVRVEGEMDYDLFEGREFEADRLVHLR